MVGTQSGEEYVDEYILLGRMGTPEDVSDTALYLASELASFVTGQYCIRRDISLERYIEIYWINSLHIGDAFADLVKDSLFHKRIFPPL
ncbi:SDR family oxidoreductase [Halorubrum sp. CBA1125]|nr:SDR family oxidoreductase [Halorubrum sp. CBA1125]